MSLLDIQEALAYLTRYSFGVYLSAEFVQKRKEIPAALLAPSLSFPPPIKVENHFWRMHGQIVVLIRRAILPGGLFVSHWRAAAPWLLVSNKPQGSRHGAGGSGTPWVSCPLVGCMACSGGVLVLLVARVAEALLAPSQVSSSFYVSMKRVWRRHQQH